MSCGYHQCLAVYVAVFLGMSMVLPPAVDGFQWIKPTTSSGEPAPLFVRSVVYYPNNVSVTMTWKWTLVGSESFTGVVIKRHKEGDKANTETQVASVLVTVSGLSKTIDNNYYNQTVETGQSGGITFTIKDVTKQTDNKDGGAVNVLVADYVYRCELHAANVNPTQRTSEIKLIVNEKPKITAPPQSQYIDVSNKQVKLRCTATGKPKPGITWDIRKEGLQHSRSGEEIIIDAFKKSDVGVYKCMAKNDYGSDTAEAVLQYTACGSGCTTDSDFAIEITNLDYNDGYDNENSFNYKELMEKIERACLLLYVKQADLKVYSCVVTGFRNGSVVAKMKLTYPANPRKPLEDAINTGKFAGYNVTTSFVDPTSVGPYVTPSSSQAPSTGPYVTTSSSQALSTYTGNNVTRSPSQAPSSGPYVTPSSSQAPSTDPVPTTVLGVLLGLSVVLNVMFIVYFVWKYKQLQGQKVRSIDREHFAGGSGGNTNTIALQNTNQSPSSQLDYEFVDDQIQPEQSSGNPSLYQPVEPHSSTYSYLSPATKLPPKPSLPSDQSQANPNTSVYQDLQDVSQQYQSLSSLSP